MTSTAAAAANTASAALGTYSGTFTEGFTTGTASNGVVTAASTTPGSVTDIVVAAVSAPTAPLVTTTAGTADAAETASLTFSTLAAGQSVTVNGLTFTATSDMTETQVGAAYASLSSGMTAAAASAAHSDSAALGVYSGTFTAGFTTGTASGGSITATSTTVNDVTDIAASAVSAPNEPTVVTSVGSATSTTISISTATPEGVVSAINDASGTTGISAQLVRVSSTGAYQIVVSGSSGADNAFTMTANDTDGKLSLGTTSATGLLTSAQDATLTVDGLSIQRSNNRIDDIITGVTLDLNGATTGSANLNLALDTTPVATKISALVDAYNMVQTVLTDAYNKDSKTAEYGASLVGDSTVQSIRSEIRAMFFPSTGSTGSNITSLRDLGVSMDAKGVMTLDKAKLSTSLQSNFAGAVTMLTNNVNGSYIPSTGNNGVANDAINKLTNLLSSDGLLVVQSNNAAKKVTDYQDQLTKLNARMTALLDRYNKQFAAMETIVGQSKSLQTSLTSTFANMNSSSNK
jgi:flagellar hook-associated protein 2